MFFWDKEKEPKHPKPPEEPIEYIAIPCQHPQGTGCSLDGQMLRFVSHYQQSHSINLIFCPECGIQLHDTSLGEEISAEEAQRLIKKGFVSGHRPNPRRK